MIDLTSYNSIQTALFVQLNVPDFQVFTFSDYNRPMSLYGINYTGIGGLMSITDSYSELKVNQTEVTITIAGIPNTSLTDFLNNKIKGSTIEVLRAIFNPVTGAILNITGNPVGKFNGLVNNYSFAETWDGQNASNTISLMCTSIVGLMKTKRSGRRCNGTDQKSFYPTDTSMDRVRSLANSNFNFGVK
jgi:hypothetical protein